MNLDQFEKQLRNRFPDWKVTAYDVPDMWSGITVKTRFSDFDVKMETKDRILVDHGKKVLQSELDSLVEFLSTIFDKVVPRLV